MPASAKPLAVFSYTLYGSDLRYSEPLLETVNRVKLIENELNAHIIFYVYFNNLSSTTLEKLASYNYVLMIHVDTSQSSSTFPNPRMWRYLAFQDFASFGHNPEWISIRDSDSLINPCEIQLVNQWLSSTFDSMTIRGHCLHLSPIMAGLFFAKKNLFEHISFLLNQSLHISDASTISYSSDQLLLARQLYPAIRNNLLVFTSFLSFYGENYVNVNLDSGSFPGRIEGSSLTSISCLYACLLRHFLGSHCRISVFMLDVVSYRVQISSIILLFFSRHH